MDILSAIADNRTERKKLLSDIADLDEVLAGPEGLIAAAFAEGHTGAGIAAATGLSKPRVFQIRDGRR